MHHTNNLFWIFFNYLSQKPYFVTPGRTLRTSNNPQQSFHWIFLYSKLTSFVRPSISMSSFHNSASDWAFCWLCAIKSWSWILHLYYIILPDSLHILTRNEVICCFQWTINHVNAWTLSQVQVAMSRYPINLSWKWLLHQKNDSSGSFSKVQAMDISAALLRNGLQSETIAVKWHHISYSSMFLNIMPKQKSYIGMFYKLIPIELLAGKH